MVFSKDAYEHLAYLYVSNCYNARKAFEQFYEERGEEMRNKATIYKIMKAPTFLKEVKKLKEELKEQHTIDREKIVAGLNEIAFGDYSPNQRMKALDMLCKMEGFYSQSLEVKGAADFTVSLTE